MCPGSFPLSVAYNRPPPVPTVEYFKVEPVTATTLRGKVSFEGTAPKNAPIDMSAERDCQRLHSGPVTAEVVVVGEGGGLANTFVWVKAGLEGKKFEAPKTPVKLDQTGCIYRPHVLALQAGQMLSVTNSDPTSHHVHPLARFNREWNKSQSSNAPPVERKFSRQEIMLPVKCNIHPWMRAYINVVDHPFFAVTGEDGTFEINGLPPGTYTIGVRHEKYGEKETSVTVGASESKQIDDFTFMAAG